MLGRHIARGRATIPHCHCQVLEGWVPLIVVRSSSLAPLILGWGGCRFQEPKQL